MTIRTWATPLTSGTFLLVGLTGILMLCKVRLGLVKVAHEWGGLLFVLAAGLHIWRNWDAMKGHLMGNAGRWAIGIFALLTAWALLPFGPKGEKGEGMRQAVPILLQARLSTLADLTHRSSGQVREALLKQAIPVPPDDPTLADIARHTGVAPARVLAAALDGVAVTGGAEERTR